MAGVVRIPLRPTRLRLKLFVKSSTEQLRPGNNSLKINDFFRKIKKKTGFNFPITMLEFLQIQLVRLVACRLLEHTALVQDQHHHQALE